MSLLAKVFEAALIGVIASSLAFGGAVIATRRWHERARRGRERRERAAMNGLLFGFPDEVPGVIEKSEKPKVIGVIVGPRLDAGPQAFIEHERERGAIS